MPIDDIEAAARRAAFPSSPEMFSAEQAAPREEFEVFGVLPPRPAWAVAPRASTPPPAPLTAEQIARREVWPASPELWDDAPPRPIDPAVVELYPASPDLWPSDRRPAPASTAALSAEEIALREAFPASPRMWSDAPAPADAGAQAAPPDSAAAGPAQAKAPDGYDPADPSYLEFQAIASEANLAPEVTPRLLALHKKALAAQEYAMQDERTRWAEETQADPEIGGPQLAQSVSVARAALDRFGDDEIRSVLSRTGLGNHRAVIRLLARLGRRAL